MKKKLLFIMNDLTMGGAQNSLVSLLQVVDYSQYEVDLLLFKQKGFFLKSVPSQVTILPPVAEFDYFDMPLKKVILKTFFRFRFDVLYARICYLFLKNEKNAAVKEQRFWKYLSRCIPKLTGNYDVAIGFLEKTPNYYCVDKVNANKKIGFILTDYEAMKMDSKIDSHYFQKLDYVISNSEKAEQSLKNIFPQFALKIKTIQDFFSKETITAMSNEKETILNSELTLISMGRLVELKSFYLAVEACKLLKEKNIPLKWFLIGEGPEKENLKNLVLKYNLEEEFYILGEKENPFPYIKKADFYVHTSKYEGKSRAVEEAKILYKPIIATRYPSILDQIEEGKTGLIVDFSPEKIAEAVLKLYSDAVVRDTIILNLKSIQKDNVQELKKLYELIH